MELSEKLQSLKSLLSRIGRDGLCIAFSGGVDSTLLLKTAASIPDLRVTAVTFSSRLNAKAELSEARAIAQELGVPHVFLKFDEFTDEEILLNPPDRCYHCKKFIFSSLREFCRANGLGAVADGTNADDLNEYRPGLRALRELHIASPLAECQMTKDDVRRAARAMGLKISEKPSAPCLATRIPYGVRLTDELLKKVEESEEFLKRQGFPRCRVRAHGDIARIEVPAEDFPALLKIREAVTKHLKACGFLYITLDLEGIRSGSMDLPLRLAGKI